MRNTRWFPGILAFCIIPLTAPSLAQQAPPFGEMLEVNVVNVEVFVTDRDGRPVTGLSRDDFQLFADGKQVEITQFYAASPAASRPIAGSPRQGPRTGDLPELANDPRPPTVIALFFDNLFLRPGSRQRVVAGLRDFLAARPEWARQTMITVPQGDGFGLLHAPGADVAAVLTSLDRLSELPAKGIHADSDHRSALAYMRDIWETLDEGRFMKPEPCDWGQEQLEAAIHNYSRAVEARTERTLSSLSRLTRSLAALPGQKAVVYVGDGLEFSPGSDLFRYLEELCPQTTLVRTARFAERRSSTDRFARLTGQANADQVTIYTLDAAGRRAPSSMSIGDFDSPRFMPSQDVDRVRRASLQNSLTFIADETGGRAFLDLNRFADTFTAIAAETAAYYSLGFQALAHGDNRLHQLEVKLPARKELKVRHRRQYRDKALSERLADSTLGALLYGLESNPLELRVARGTSQSGDDGTFRVPLHLIVKLEPLVLLREGDLWIGKLHLIFVSRDAEGRQSPVRQKAFTLRLDSEQRASGFHTLAFEWVMRPGEHIVAVGLGDELGRTASYLSARLDVTDGS